MTGYHPIFLEKCFAMAKCNNYTLLSAVITVSISAHSLQLEVFQSYQ